MVWEEGEEGRVSLYLSSFLFFDGGVLEEGGRELFKFETRKVEIAR